MTQPVTTPGTVLAVAQTPLGGALAADAAASATTLALDDVANFGENGTLVVGWQDAAGTQEVIAYTAVDPAADTITLASGLAAGWDAGTRVYLWDPATSTPSIDYDALVAAPGAVDNNDAIDAVIAHALIPLLPEGIREPGGGESVTLTRDGNQWYVTDVHGRQPQIAGAMITPGTVPEAALDFTIEAAGATVTIGSTAPAAPKVGDVWFDATSGYAMKQWDGAAWQPYQWGAGSISDGAISTSKINFTARTIGANTVTIATSSPGSPITGDLWYDSSSGYRLNQFNGTIWQPFAYGTAALADGAVTAGKVAFTARDIGGVTVTVASSAPASPHDGDIWYDSANGYRMMTAAGGAFAAAQFGTGAIAAGSVTAALIAGDTITAAQIAAGAVTTSELASGSVTTDKVAAAAITAALIAAGTITAAQIAAGTITGDRLAAATITGDRVAAGAITADLIAAGAIVAGKIATGALDATTITAAALSAGVISAGSIGSSQIIHSSIGTSDFIIDTSGGRILVYQAATPTVTTVTATGAGSWTAPAGVTVATVECWGPGLGGQAGNPTEGGNGGGGGEYACEPAYPVTPGNSYAYSIPAGGPGGTTNWGSTPGDTVFDAGGVTAHGATTFGDPGTGSANSIHFPGGRGGESAHPPGAGGGSSGGSARVGNNGHDSTTLAVGAGGAAPLNAGAGGNGGLGVIGSSGAAPGGGGGGGGTSKAGGAGGRGQIRISYVAAVPVLIGSIASVAGTDQYSNAYPAGIQFAAGVIGRRQQAVFSSDLAATSGTEVVGYSQALTATAGRRYRVWLRATANASATGLLGTIRIRYAAGTVTSSSTQAGQILRAAPVASGSAGRLSLLHMAEFVAAATGTVNIAVTIQLSAGTGTITLVGAAEPSEITIDDVGT